ncbi:MAG: PBP1A family penicillin-binding protein [Coriobacteriia bacterium]|nr:PBP1A family penicillin-binding protein [Coriobacteriia bacterium]
MTTSRRLVKILRVPAVILGALVVVFLGAGFYLYLLSQGLPDLASASQGLAAARTSIVYASDGSVLAEWHGEQDRKVVPLGTIPKAMRDAVVAAEDPRFYEHHGVDTEAISRALRGEGGGSSITQQLVRLLYAESDRSFTTKVRQALSAYQLDSRTSKDKVLEAYLNMAYFGQGRYGVESAARGYFGKPASALSVSESALLAGLIKSPATYAPSRDVEAAIGRRNEVLDTMRDLGLMSSEQEVAARVASLTVVPPADSAKVAPYFVEYVKQDLLDRFGAKRVYTGGLRVYTSLDPATQKNAESAVATILDRRGDPEAALVSIDPHTGRILAMVGGRDFAKEQFNLATQGRRQPGSAFKPFVLVAALESGVSPDRRFATAPFSVRVKDGTWRVENYENSFPSSRITLRAATNYSVNAVYARLVMEVGPDKVVDAARRMGITSPLEANPAIALGGLSRGVSPLEMASAYGTLAAGGMRVQPLAVVLVTDDKGARLYEPKVTPKRVLQQTIAAQASGMLHDVVERGTGVNARFGAWAAGKTGTTQSYRDAWFVGYTGDVVTSVWVGYPQAQVDMLNVHGMKVAGGTFPAQIWSRFMARFTSVSAAAPAVESSAAAPATLTAGARSDSGVVHVRICRDTFLLANERCPNVAEVDLPVDLVPKSVCRKH